MSRYLLKKANFSETAEEQYRQQVGAGPNYALGASDRHFDPEKSEALKAIKAGEADEFGHTFNKKIVEAETPHVPPPQVWYNPLLRIL